ncbi:MAG: hypothetical protein EON55_05980 [Alphaproteobacteria bacterium]|nr:MAG: hypothetical protein EON55_05980 [Alphaproteobacteria bacterium]
MNHEDFRIGLEFYTATGRWRCTDIGTRTVLAISLDTAEITRNNMDGSLTTRKLTREQANQQNYFSGPPYGVVETSFDEYDLPGCMRASEYILTGGEGF